MCNNCIHCDYNSNGFFCSVAGCVYSDNKTICDYFVDEDYWMVTENDNKRC